MIEAGKGSIVNFGSLSWMIMLGNLPAYTASKAAMHGMSRSLARDWGRHGIRVNTLVPGWVMTEKAAHHHRWSGRECDDRRRPALKGRVYPADIAQHGAVPRRRRQPHDFGTGLHRRRRLGALAAVGRASRLRIDRPERKKDFGWPSEPSSDRSARAEKGLRLAARAVFGSIGRSGKEDFGQAPPGTACSNHRAAAFLWAGVAEFLEGVAMKSSIVVAGLAVLALSGCSTMNAYTGQSQPLEHCRWRRGRGRHRRRGRRHRRCRHRHRPTRRRADRRRPWRPHRGGGRPHIWTSRRPSCAPSCNRPASRSPASATRSSSTCRPNITFATDSATVQPAFNDTLVSVGLVLKKFNKTVVDVTGPYRRHRLRQPQPGSVAAPCRRRRHHPRQPGRRPAPLLHRGQGRGRSDRLQRHRNRPLAEPPRRNPDLADLAGLKFGDGQGVLGLSRLTLDVSFPSPRGEGGAL